MKRYAVVDQAGNVQNVVLWDGERSWTPPADAFAVEDADGAAEPGGSYDGKAFAPPAVPDPLPEPPDFAAAMLGAFMALETIEADSADALLAQYPSFGVAMTQGNGPLAWQRLSRALQTGKVTQDQFDAIAAAMQANRIPTGQD